MMLALGWQSKREITRTRIRVRTAMAAQTREQGQARVTSSVPGNGHSWGNYVSERGGSALKNQCVLAGEFAVGSRS